MSYTRTKSQALLDRASRSLAGGVGSVIRLAELPGPLYFERGEGARLYDVDGNEYIDYVLGQGPLILGHNPKVVLDAVHQQIDRLLVTAGQHIHEVETSERIQRIVPCAQLVRYNNSGSEAVQMAFRLARAFTGRQKYIKFEGHFHGWPDTVAISTAPTAENMGPREKPNMVAGSAGMATNVFDNIILLPWNDLAIVERTLEAQAHEIACIITEPIMFNAGGAEPRPGFLEGLRKLCDQYGVVLVFDEVISGFRVSLGGAQELYGVTPDLATFAKGIAAGFPLSALAGRRDILDLAARNVVNYAGTYNSNPVVMAAANAATKYLDENRDQVYGHLRAMGGKLNAGLTEIFARRGVPALVNAIGPVIQLAFTKRDKFYEYRDYLDRDANLAKRFTTALAEHGVRTTLRGTWYISAAHSEADIEETLDRAESALGAALG
ncbi:MAG: aspartate aminotransferase family protein [Chloroflexi bacterium]|nr:aspartate aminotransferase family protein [Chloroflexota bacterium]